MVILKLNSKEQYFQKCSGRSSVKLVHMQEASTYRSVSAAISSLFSVKSRFYLNEDHKLRPEQFAFIKVKLVIDYSTIL